MSSLRERVSGLRVSVLPDFYFDRIVLLGSLTESIRRIQRKAASGGGNIRGVAQFDVRGGNAANLAFVLSSLSVKTNLFCIGDRLTEAVLSTHPPACSVRVIDGRPSYTTALEFDLKGKPVNIMTSDVGDLSSFDGRKLTRNDLAKFKESNCIALVNWSSNSKGNQLAKRVFSLGGRRSRLNFLDPADITGAEHRVRTFATDIIGNGLLDVLSLNENEARMIARILSITNLPYSYGSRQALKAVRLLQESLNVNIDLHTPIGCASASRRGEAWVATIGTVKGSVTGAGDAWDAGDIVGHLLNFEDEARLRFANACAYLYVHGKGKELPTLQTVTRLLRST